MFLANVLQPLIGVEQWTLKALHSVGLGWGLAIVGLTLMVRLCTLPLVVRQFKAQRELRKHMPQMKELQQHTSLLQAKPFEPIPDNHTCG